ncbi:MAG: hypothetical protein K0U68_09655 [Gammaproteobacteria bacterium]|nr:hypothetical protein [Gammaproteobacteria bacterium]
MTQQLQHQQLDDNRSTAFSYTLYGLKIQSNLDIPGLLPAESHNICDVSIQFQCAENNGFCPEHAEILYASPGFAENGEPYYKVWKSPDLALSIQYTDGTGFTTFLIDVGCDTIKVIHSESIPIQDVFTYFLGPVIGCTLSLKHITCLHAGVVAIDNKALAIIGPKGAGKSTTTAALADAGLAVVSDDIAPLRIQNGNYFVAPGYMNLRLWPNSIDIFSDVSSDNLVKVLSIAEKRFLNLSTDTQAQRWRFHNQPLQLAAVYSLNPRDEQSDAITIEPLSPANGLLKLAANTYPEYALHPNDRQRNFNVLGQFANAVPVRSVDRPDNLDQLNTLRDAIINDYIQLVSR